MVQVNIMPDGVYITRFALERYLYAKHMRRDERSISRAIDALRADFARASLRQTDLLGRELWRMSCAPKLRFVLSYAPHPGGDLPQLIWCGSGRPPARHWSPAIVDESYPRALVTRPSRGEQR